MIIHIPHANNYIPNFPCIFNSYIGKKTFITDKNVREYFNYGRLLIYPYNRIFCDVERFWDNDVMDEIGMGACYTHNIYGERMRILSEWDKNLIKKYFYNPWHKMFEQVVENEIKRFNKCLIIDAHTFSAIPLPYEKDRVRPEICIGYDESKVLGKKVSKMFSEHFDVLENRPFNGSIKPIKYISDSRVDSVMIEVRQDMPIEKTNTIITEILQKIEGEYYEKKK